MRDFWKGNGCGEPFKGDSVYGGVGFLGGSICSRGNVLRSGHRRIHIYHVGSMFVVFGRFHG